MMRFADGDIDVLVATTIIENGLDIPNANTIIINRADHFGLAQLYQLRGRVGRSAQRGHCYLLYDKTHPLSYDARRRLEAIIESSEELGAGFRIAMRDLEIRGAGELLGARQEHGHIDSVGFDLYTRLLAQAINEARRKKDRFDKALENGNDNRLRKHIHRHHRTDGRPIFNLAMANLPISQSGALPKNSPLTWTDPLQPPVQLDCRSTRASPTYVEDEELRLQLYRRIAGITHAEALDEMRRELIDRFGKLTRESGGVPEEVDNLFFQIRIKSAGRARRRRPHWPRHGATWCCIATRWRTWIAARWSGGCASGWGASLRMTPVSCPRMPRAWGAAPSICPSTRRGSGVRRWRGRWRSWRWGKCVLDGGAARNQIAYPTKACGLDVGYVWDKCAIV
jgi:hypothetical protein